MSAMETTPANTRYNLRERRTVVKPVIEKQKRTANGKMRTFQFNFVIWGPDRNEISAKLSAIPSWFNILCLGRCHCFEQCTYGAEIAFLSERFKYTCKNRMEPLEKMTRALQEKLAPIMEKCPDNYWQVYYADK
jgi:hypothetical protein